MPSLAKLVITNVRNISQADIAPGPGFNLFYGDNGSGKTSVLEALYLLGLGRSFRSHLQKPLIREGLSQATVFGETADGLAVGVQRPLRGLQTIHIAGQKPASLAELSQALPLQLINSDTFNILEGGPHERRRFLDWGVFHVEHHFIEAWRRTKLALLSRNSLLKQAAPLEQLEPWTRELVRNAETIDQLRASYLKKLSVTLGDHLQNLGEKNLDRLSLSYRRGWEQDDLYAEIQQGLQRDRKQGFTSTGPQRADLLFRIGNTNAADVLSRGQLKLLVCALKIAQGKLLLDEKRQRCIFLLDDLPAELDQGNRSRVCGMLAALESQVFLTCIEKEMLLPSLAEVSIGGGLAHKLFHVKHGSISAM